jgi:hypothetical protein
MNLRRSTSGSRRSIVMPQALALISGIAVLFVFSSLLVSNARITVMANEQPTPGPDQQQTMGTGSMSAGVSMTTAELMDLEHRAAATAGVPIEANPVRKRPSNPASNPQAPDDAGSGGSQASQPPVSIEPETDDTGSSGLAQIIQSVLAELGQLFKELMRLGQ